MRFYETDCTAKTTEECNENRTLEICICKGCSKLFGIKLKEMLILQGNYKP